jgi:hypothetical protein
MHDSGPVWVASSSPYETFIHNTLSVLPAHRNPKQTERQINLKPEKSETPIPNEVGLEF